MPSSVHLPGTRRPAVSALLCLLYVTACHTWQAGMPTPAQFVEREHPDRVRVTRSDGSMMSLESPVVRGDSLVGRIGGRGDSAQVTSMALRDVTSVEVSKNATVKTVLLTSGIVIVVVGVGLYAAWEISCTYGEC